MFIDVYKEKLKMPKVYNQSRNSKEGQYNDKIQNVPQNTTDETNVWAKYEPNKKKKTSQMKALVLLNDKQFLFH